MLKRKREERRRSRESSICSESSDTEGRKSGKALTPSERREKARQEREQMLAEREARREKMRELREKEEAEKNAKKRRGSIVDGPLDVATSTTNKAEPEVIDGKSKAFFDEPVAPDEDDNGLFDMYTGRRKSLPRNAQPPKTDKIKAKNKERKNNKIRTPCRLF